MVSEKFGKSYVNCCKGTENIVHSNSSVIMLAHCERHRCCDQERQLSKMFPKDPWWKMASEETAELWVDMEGYVLWLFLYFLFYVYVFFCNMQCGNVFCTTVHVWLISYCLPSQGVGKVREGKTLELNFKKKYEHKKI